MPYLQRLQERLSEYFPARFIDIRRENRDLIEFDRVWMDMQPTKFGVHPMYMNGVISKFKVTPEQIADDIAIQLRDTIQQWERLHEANS